MPRNPDLDELAQKLEKGRRQSAPLLLLLGRACGRLAGTPDMDELARQGLALLRSNDDGPPAEQGVTTVESVGKAQVRIQVDRHRVKEWHRAFQSAFPTASALRDMVSSATGLQLSTEQWAPAETAYRSIDSLFDWASSQGQLDALVSAAVAYNPGNPALRAVSQSSSGPDQAAVRAEFGDRFRELSQIERFSLLQSIYGRIPVPAFYQDIARLIKAGYIRQVLTTNVDSLLEQALEAQGLARDLDFTVVVLGTQFSREALSALEEQEASDRPVIIKLHGDISQGEFGVSQDEIDVAVRAAKRYIKDELEADLVMLGYEAESAPFNDWLVRARSFVWWVHIEPPKLQMDPAHVRWVQLPVDAFVATLVPQLFAMRSMNARPRGFQLESAPAASDDPRTRDIPPPELSEADALRRELARMRAEAISLAIAPGSSATPVQRQEHAAERRRRIRDLEDRLRALPDVRDDLLQLLDRIEQSAAHPADAAQVDPDTLAYLGTQLGIVRAQFHASPFNPHVVSAAIGAVLVVADRLGPSVVSPLDVRALANYGPSTLVRS